MNMNIPKPTFPPSRVEPKREMLAELPLQNGSSLWLALETWTSARPPSLRVGKTNAAGQSFSASVPAFLRVEFVEAVHRWAAIVAYQEAERGGGGAGSHPVAPAPPEPSSAPRTVFERKRAPSGDRKELL